MPLFQSRFYVVKGPNVYTPELLADWLTHICTEQCCHLVSVNKGVYIFEADQPHTVQHNQDCGTKYRGCAPDCPKDQQELARINKFYELINDLDRILGIEIPAEVVNDLVHDLLLV